MELLLELKEFEKIRLNDIAIDTVCYLVLQRAAIIFRTCYNDLLPAVTFPQHSESSRVMLVLCRQAISHFNKEMFLPQMISANWAQFFVAVSQKLFRKKITFFLYR